MDSAAWLALICGMLPIQNSVQSDPYPSEAAFPYTAEGRERLIAARKDWQARNYVERHTTIPDPRFAPRPWRP